MLCPGRRCRSRTILRLYYSRRKICGLLHQECTWLSDSSNRPKIPYIASQRILFASTIPLVYMGGIRRRKRLPLQLERDRANEIVGARRSPKNSRKDWLSRTNIRESNLSAG